MSPSCSWLTLFFPLHFVASDPFVRDDRRLCRPNAEKGDRMNKAAIVIAALVLLGGVASAQSSDEEAIVPIESLRRGDFATIRGEVVRYRDSDEILLRDGSGRIEIFVRGARSPEPPAEVGETITVSGWVDDDAIAFSREMYATEIVRGDGTVISIDAPVGDEW